MEVPSQQRRQVLLAISQLVLASALTACTDAVEQQAAPVATGDSDLELLASVAYDLFPYPALNAEMYVRIGEHLLQGGNPALADGLQQLRAQVGDLPWKEVDETQRLAVLTELEDSPFFAAVRAGSLEVLYRSPEVFAMVGYGGSAIEQGGYINRGFDSIDWLPTPQQ
jgi:hypothetical protein